MPKYNVSLNKHMSYIYNFSIEAKNEEEILSKLNAMNIDFLEEECDWIITDYVRPVVASIDSIDNSTIIHTEVSDSFLEEYNHDNR